MKRTRIFPIIAFIPIIVALVFIFVPQKFNVPPNPTEVSIGKTKVQVTRAKTSEEWNTGLSGRQALEENTGMLFIAKEPDVYPFWMKDMLFPIDIIWIDSEGKVVYIKEHASPDSYPEIFTPTAPAQYILEVPDGFVQMHNVLLGDKVKIT